LKTLHKILFFTFAVSFLFSCSKEAEHPLTGKWVSENSETEYIIFDAKGENRTFVSTAFFDVQTKGTWQILNEKIELSYVQNSTNIVDSLTVENSNSGSSTITIWENNAPVSTISSDGANPPVQQMMLSYTITENVLNVRSKNYNKLITPVRSVSIASIFRGIGGMAFLILIAWFFSKDRKKINWSLVGKGLILQVIIALLVLKVPFIEGIFDSISQGFVKVISFTDEGIDFLFGQFGTGTVQGPLITFAVKVLPTIIFFSALVSLFYYWGILQKIVYVFAWIMKKFMRLSGAESLAAAGNVFLGQTEAPLLVKPYLGKMTKSEIMCLMTGGMATIAGGVLAAYVGFLGGDDPIQQAFFAKHLLTASIISAPAAIIAAKILVPETEKINEDLSISKEKIGTNALEAISNGTSDGLRLAVNVGAMLLVFIALMAFGNWTLNLLGGIGGLNEVIAANTNYDGLSFEFILGYIGRPIVWLLGVNWADSIYVGELLGTKTVLNEFIGYQKLGEMNVAGVFTSEKSLIMSTYILCGFANFSSIGIQIGGIGSLVPGRKGLLSKLGMQALIGGTIACLMTASIVGMLY
jgi:CNT family concentrative nucleoside transporter